MNFAHLWKFWRQINYHQTMQWNFYTWNVRSTYYVSVLATYVDYLTNNEAHGDNGKSVARKLVRSDLLGCSLVVNNEAEKRRSVKVFHVRPLSIWNEMSNLVSMAANYCYTNRGTCRRIGPTFRRCHSKSPF